MTRSNRNNDMIILVEKMLNEFQSNLNMNKMHLTYEKCWEGVCLQLLTKFNYIQKVLISYLERILQCCALNDTSIFERFLDSCKKLKINEMCIILISKKIIFHSWLWFFNCIFEINTYAISARLFKNVYDLVLKYELRWQSYWLESHSRDISFTL